VIDDVMPQAALAQFTASVPVVIRKCRRSDLRALEWYGLFWEHREIIEATFEAQRRGEMLMVIADLNGFPAGQVWIDLDLKRESGAAYVWAVRVLPCLTRFGIGAQLLLTTEELLRQREYCRVELCVGQHNLEALRLYQRLGYQVVETLRGEYSYTTPAGDHVCIPLHEWVMRKEIAHESPCSDPTHRDALVRAQ
jgi:ribosomal protein S18 acetylase RimI-like enzyme